MTHVATFIAPSATPLLTPGRLGRAAAILPAAQAGPAEWLDPGVAADIAFKPAPGDSIGHLADPLREAVGEGVDVVLQPAAGRRKALLLADMDSTIIEQECIDELAGEIGRRNEVAAITRRSVNGEVSFEDSLRERVALLRGLSVATAARVADRIDLMAGAGALVRTMRAHGAFTAIASGGFTLFTAHVAHLVGFDRHYANTLVVEGGKLAGTLQEPIFGRASKRACLRALRAEFGLAPEATLAVGDGANDLAMLEEAGLGVAFRAKPAVAAVARARIDHADLTALLYVQGYRRDEFVA